VAVARALATDPAVVLADEPTASLDRAAADALIADLAALARTRGRTLIIVSHDERALAAMDAIATMRDGELAA
jgi:putative ABC transport system ATP-binding protein